AFRPFHFARGTSHPFLAVYWMIPPMGLVLLWICSGAGRKASSAGDDGARSPAAPVVTLPLAVVICALLSASGFYYALFGCFLLGIAGLSASLSRRELRPLATAGVLMA